MIALFKSHYSIGRSILTLNKAGDSEDGGADSIFDICQESKLKTLHLVEDSMSGCIEANNNAKAIDVKLNFGLRITVVEDMVQKETEGDGSKIVIVIRNNDGYKRLCDISSLASTTGFYYVPRIDFAALKKAWSDKDLLLAIPFYDSFIFKNTLSFSTCVPNFGFTNPFFFVENNDLPFDPLIQTALLKFTKTKKMWVDAQSVYYKSRKDFKAYLTFRCLHNRQTLEKPNLEHMCSDNFCFEAMRQ